MEAYPIFPRKKFFVFQRAEQAKEANFFVTFNAESVDNSSDSSLCYITLLSKTMQLLSHLPSLN